MRIKKVPITQAVGHILLHNQVGPDGRRALRKGRELQPDDVAILQALEEKEVYVAVLDADDVGENEAAHRLGELLGGPALHRSSATTGRVNLMAQVAGVLKVNVEALLALNDISGFTLATRPNNSQVEPKKRVGTIKIIPYSVPRIALDRAAAIISDNSPLVDIKPFSMKRAALITTGSEAAREKVVDSFTPALRDRLSGYNTELVEGPYVPEDEQAIGEALRRALDSGVDMVLIAGETSIMDTDDITPRAIKAVGGDIVHHGVPVEPGNLLLLAYRDRIPIVGAPGCARSRSYNVVDMVLPRLATGEHLTRRDLIELGHGGYLQ